MKPEISAHLEKIFLKQKDNFKYHWQEDLKSADASIRLRVENELLDLGPLNSLLLNPEITEILVNRFNKIFYEKAGLLHQHADHFYSEHTYNSMLERLAQKCETYLSREKPFIEAQLNNLRITIIFSEISRGYPLLSIRIQPELNWSLPALFKNNFFNQNQLNIITKILETKKNFLVIGGTGSGKTSFMQALLGQINTLERMVIIEDTQELHLPNQVSVSLLTRQDPSQSVQDISMDDLLKRSLRLRPDRLVVGEIRGPEARSLLLALSTGHDGSFGSLHARSAQEAMLRLEMLIQMGAPQWSLSSIRRLIAMTVQNIIVLEKSSEGGASRRKIKGIFEINSLEETGLTFTQLDE
ncbi:MAG: ATPase, T2SS/T4P/T4SS family [Bdellovibrionota bacterium]